MVQEARKPMFDLRPTDGAIGSHAQLVQTCYAEFKHLAEVIAEICEFEKAA
jgi:chromosome partitioning protein